MSKKILITSALPYANGPLHFGHLAGAYLPADCYARFQRLRQNDVLYICGSDEYGIAVTLSAELAGRTPKEQVDLFHEINRQFFEKLHISFDHYSRTTWEGHKEPTQQFFLDLLANGYIEERITDQLYSEADQCFLADRYVEGTCPRCGFDKARGDECQQCGASYEATDLKNPRSKMTQAHLIKKPTKHWFLLMDQFKDRLNQWISTKNWKPNVINFIKDYIEHLHARAITRDTKWGIPVPLDNSEGKVLYVWFDAPIGYLSATKEWALKKQDEDKWKEYWLDADTHFVQFMGKDNITFHASIFPAMLMGQNQPYKLVDDLVANEFYNLEGKQFSKSDGWTIDLEDFFHHYSTDQIRYTIAANAPETSDSEFTWKDFQMRCNSELVGKYGNLVNRILVFIHSRCEGKIPVCGELEEMDHQFLNQLKLVVEQSAQSYSQFKVRRASQLMMELAQLGNGYFDSKRPWVDAKDPSTHARMMTTLWCCLEGLKALALISSPIIPQTANQLWALIGFEQSLNEIGWDHVLSLPLQDNHVLPPSVILFQKVEDERIDQEILRLNQFSAQQKKVVASVPSILNPLKKEITLDQVKELDLRVGIIESAKPVPKSKKLLQLEVNIGLEKRTILAGISQTYQPENLIGKQVIVVANLKPAVLMGIESQGMILAAKNGTEQELIILQNSQPGWEIG